MQHSVFRAPLHIATVAKSNSQTECPTVSITELTYKKAWSLPWGKWDITIGEKKE